MATLTKVGQLLNPGNYLNGAIDCIVRGNYAYVVSFYDDAFIIINIADKANPVRVGQLTGAANYLGSAIAVFVNEDSTYAYVVGRDQDAFVIIDITTKTAPVRVGQLTGAGEYLNDPHDVKVVGNYAYVTGYTSDSLVIIDITNKTAPVRVGQLTGSGNYLDGPRGLYVSEDGNYAYVTSYSQYALSIINCTNKTAPYMEGEIHSSTSIGYAYDVVVDGTYAYIASSEVTSFAIVDITNKSSPSFVNNFISGLLGGCHGLDIYEDSCYAFIASSSNDKIAALDIRTKNDILYSTDISGAGNYLENVYNIYRDGNYLYTCGRDSDSFVILLFTPDPPEAPTNVDCVSGIQENTITWDESLMTDSYNLYWMKYEYFSDDFSVDLDEWDIYKDTGTETVEISSEKLYGSNTIGTNWYVVNKNNIPSGDFDVQVDLVTYTPDDNDNGLYAAFKVLDEYPFASGDSAEIYYYVSSGGAQYNITTNLWINGSNYDTSITIAGQPTKFRITRVGTTVSVYYYISSWIQVDSMDFSTYAANLILATIDGIQNSGNGGILEFDNFDYYVDVETLGTKITDVTSPYDHTSLDAGENYIYVITGENTGGEGDASEIVSGIPEFGPPDPPTNISVTKGEAQNIITFDSTAEYNHIYWDTTSGVTKDTGTKISDVDSPYIHDDLNPSLTYYYILTSENEYGEGNASSEYVGNPYPEAPTNLNAVADIEQITLSWDPVSGADSYNIYWDTTSGVIKDTGTKISDVASPYIHSSLTPGQTYYYIITSEDEDGESSESSEIYEVPDLSIPSNINAYMSASLTIRVSWDPCAGATQYNIYWAKSPGVTKETGTKISDVTSPYNHEDLDDGVTYYYIITAENALIESNESEEVNDTAYLLPTDPINVDATAALYSNIISWDSTGSGLFNIYWDTTSGVTKDTGTKITNVTSPYIHYTPSHLIPFYYVITGYAGVFETDESEEVSAIPYIESYTYPDQDRTIDAFSDGRFSSNMNRITRITTLEDIILFPEQTFKMEIDSTSEITIGKGIFIKDDILVHIQETYLLDFSNNDYYIDSTGDMEEEGYYYIVIKYEYKRQRSGPRASYHIIRDSSLYDSSSHIFLGTVKIVDSEGSYIIDSVYTYDPLDETIRRPTIPNAASMTIDAGEL